MCCAAGNQENTVLQLTADVCCTVGNQENTVLQPAVDVLHRR